MSEQKHLIKRQLIELTIPNAAAAPAIQEEISRVYRQRIVPLIDQLCSELGAPDRVYRIDSLELDLGTLNTQELETQFVERVKTTLRKQLAAQIDLQEKTSTPTDDPKTRSALELFALFAQTGSLPWWADHQQPGLLAENLEQLLRESPSAFAELLSTLFRDASVRQRIVSQYSDAQLAQLCGLLVPAHQQVFLSETQALIVHLKHAKARQSVWRNSLQVAALGGRDYPTLAAFHQAVLVRVTKELGTMTPKQTDPLAQRLKQLQTKSEESTLAMAWAELIAQTPRLSDALRRQLRKATQNGAPRLAAEHVLQILKTSREAELTRIFESALAGSVLAEGELTTLLRQLESRGGALTEVWSALRGIVGRLPALAQTRWLAALTAAQGSPSAEDILPLLHRPASEHGLRPEDQTHLLHLLGEAPAPALDLHFSATDEVTVTNAGLVVLWPFLTSFFSHFDLLEERDFKDLAARQRAVGLLQVLASGQGEFPEYLLPLNKLLCGLDAAQPFDFGPPLQKREAKECASLLKAVIAQAPILKDMSVDGFRGSFLLRNGLLTTQSGHWLLRVEHQSYDLVLSRFPWSWEWVKLPWMQAPLRVEWKI